MLRKAYPYRLSIEKLYSQTVLSFEEKFSNVYNQLKNAVICERSIVALSFIFPFSLFCVIRQIAFLLPFFHCARLPLSFFFRWTLTTTIHINPYFRQMLSRDPLIPLVHIIYSFPNRAEFKKMKKKKKHVPHFWK